MENKHMKDKLFSKNQKESKKRRERATTRVPQGPRAFSCSEKGVKKASGKDLKSSAQGKKGTSGEEKSLGI